MEQIKYTLIQRMLSSVDAYKYQYPANPKAVNRIKEEHYPILFHKSNTFYEKKGEDGVVSLYRKGHTYTNPNKKLSKRDLHHQKGN